MAVDRILDSFELARLLTQAGVGDIVIRDEPSFHLAVQARVVRSASLRFLLGDDARLLLENNQSEVRGGRARC